jgi:hypothetical protein
MMTSIDNTPILTDMEPSSGCDISNISNIAEDVDCEAKKADVHEVVMITTNEPLVECCKKMREIKQKTNTEVIHIALVCPCYKDNDCDNDCDDDCKCGQRAEVFQQKDCKCGKDCKCKKNEEVPEINCCQNWCKSFSFCKS